MSSAKLVNSKKKYEAMISKAIENATKLGIGLYHPFHNSANGNCAFEGVIDNINGRPCFGEKYTESPDYYRTIWMAEVERIGFEDWNMGLSKSEWHNEWAMLKNSRAYEYTIGDLIIPGIAHAIKKNILIFDTSPVAYTPVFVVSASVFGSNPTTDIPVCLAYDRTHYEQLVPESDDDVIKTTQLSNKLLSGSRIEMFQSANKREEGCQLSEYEVNFPSLSQAKNAKAFEEIFCSMTLTELKQIPVKQRTKEQQRRYKNLMYLKSKKEMSEDQLEEKRKKNRDNMNTYRQNLDEGRKKEDKMETKNRIKKLRDNLDEDGKNKEKNEQRERIRKFRDNLDEERKNKEKIDKRERMKKFRDNIDEERKKKDKMELQNRVKKLRDNRDEEGKNKEKNEQRERMKKFRDNIDEERKKNDKLEMQTRIKKLRDNKDEEEKNKEKIEQRERMKKFRDHLDDSRKETERREKKQRMRDFRDNQDVTEKEEKNRTRRIQRKTMIQNQPHNIRLKLKRKDRERKSCSSELKRLKKFFAATRYGPIFVCSSCEQKMFENWVCELDTSIIDKVKEKNSEVYKKVFSNGLIEVKINTMEDGKENINPTKAYLCKTCKKHLLNGRIPPMSSANGLRLIEVDPELQLTELENNLIAKRILFQKIYQLPRSRIAACKDKLVNIPIYDDDVINTVTQLPRTPNEAGLLEVKLKRKMQYDNFHKKQYVDKDKIFHALEFLRRNKHPGYEFYDPIHVYENRCQDVDPKGFESVFVYDDGIPKIMELDEYVKLVNKKEDGNNVESLEIDKVEDNTDDKQNDPTRKFQFDYDRSVCMVDKYPEAAVAESSNEKCLSFAPGEGKVPENILMTENWDIDAFPMKHPDGKNGLQHKRDSKLSDQYYFVQRLRNKDQRFATDPAYKFAAGAYLEKKQLQKNINVSFQRGRKTVLPTGQNSYSLEDGFSVFDKISNTPAYWKTAKYEMISKLENLGPFQFFFTLSCADSRWDENFSSILSDLGISVHYQFDANGNEETKVDIGDGSLIPLKEYLDQYVSESQHELIRKNVLNSSRNYNHRVKAFINNIILDKQNPMSVKYYSTKVEFQGRGAGHNHGVLWLDLEKMEYYVENQEGQLCDLDTILSKAFAEKNAKQYIKEMLYSICHGKVEDTEKMWSNKKMQDLFRVLLGVKDFENKFDYSDILKKFPLYGISSAFRKFQTHEDLFQQEENAIKNFAKKFTTCTLSPAMLEDMTNDPVLKKRSKSLLETIKTVNIHNHTRTCKKYDTSCRFGFGKFPIWETLIAKPYNLFPKETQEKYMKVLKDVRKVLDDEKVIQNILNFYNKDEETKEEYVRNRKERILKVLNIAGLTSEEDYELYKSALTMSKSGYNIVLERDVDEMYVNSYNPEWARAWNGNHDIQICLDYFAIITYITEYYTKDDTETMKLLLEALKSNPCQSLKDKMKVLMTTYISARQMGETEVLYKIFPDFHLKDSNVTTIFVPVSKKDQRSKFLLKVDEDLSYNAQEKVKIEGRDGLYVEKYDIISKYERREDGLEDLSFSQFAKMYTASWTSKDMNANLDSEEENIHCENDFDRDTFEDIDTGSKFDFMMKCLDENADLEHNSCKTQRGNKLPRFIKLKYTFPGEAPYMRKRKHPAVLRFHKFRQDTKPNEFFFSESLLYKPFSSEDELETFIAKITSDNLEHYNACVSCVKHQTMEFLDNVSEARHFAEEFQRNEQVGQDLNPQGEQDNDECDYEGLIEHPEFPNLWCDDLEDDSNKAQTEKTHRIIEIDDLEKLREKTRRLDYYQKKVVEIGIRYARDVVKSLKSKNPLPEAPKLMVHGGAGSGKSTVINILKQWIQLILQTSGDNPDCPYIFITAPTGTAAANIKGQTLHSTFGFNFGNEHFSLSDKKRDEKRSQLQHLRVVIIDEISMVKSDLLFQLDMRLKEVTQKIDKPFGGVAIFAFGDLLQLRPIQARYIFEEPKCKDYLLAYHSKAYWQSFQAINLVENHRQDKDREYAEILNRIRVGDIQDDDMKLLESRIRPLDHKELDGAMFISCTNLEVNKYNNLMLNSLGSELITVEAVNLHPTIKDFKPQINSRGNVGTERNETPFRQSLELKIGARVMLTYNIDVLDCLTNGARGEIKAFIKSQTGYIKRVIIKFDEECQGAGRRLADKVTSHSYPGCTAIDRVVFQYSLGRKVSSVSNSARVIQFPLRLCFATTSHKFQGQTVHKPNKIVVDLRTVFTAAMAYVILSRVQEIAQLFILGCVPRKKIFADPDALLEFERLNNISMNNNPSTWEIKSEKHLKIFSLNCQSIKPKLKYIRDDALALQADLMCLSETWLNSDRITTDLEVAPYSLHVNSVGQGNGLAIYHCGKDSQFVSDVKTKAFQITKFTSKNIDVISVYISDYANSSQVLDSFGKMIDFMKTTIICGDFNICYKQKKNHSIILALEGYGFKQLVKGSTHIQGGHIDHVYALEADCKISVDLETYSPYYTAKDHDALLIDVTFI